MAAETINVAENTDLMTNPREYSESGGNIGAIIDLGSIKHICLVSNNSAPVHGTAHGNRPTMLTADELERYARHIVLREVGGPGQTALKEASALVIGAGGLGAPVLMYLAAAGIGTLGVVDDDIVSLSNLQRQSFGLRHRVGGLLGLLQRGPDRHRRDRLRLGAGRGGRRQLGLS